MSLYQPGYRNPSQIVYSFTMTAGADSTQRGYGTTAGVGADFGSISNEPIEGQTLEACIYNTGSDAGQIFFDGDILSLLEGKTVWVDSVEYPFDFDWSLSVGNTRGAWDVGNAPVFVDSNGYLIEIK